MASELLGGIVTTEGLQIPADDYVVTACTAAEEYDLLSSAKIEVMYNTEILYELTVTWQEVLP